MAVRLLDFFSFHDQVPVTFSLLCQTASSSFPTPGHSVSRHPHAENTTWNLKAGTCWVREDCPDGNCRSLMKVWLHSYPLLFFPLFPTHLYISQNSLSYTYSKLDWFRMSSYVILTPINSKGTILQTVADVRADKWLGRPIYTNH